jgi:hypothetical protein
MQRVAADGKYGNNGLVIIGAAFHTTSRDWIFSQHATKWS